MTKPNESETYSEEEAARRRDELAKRILRMPPQPRKPHPSKAAEKAKLGHPASPGICASLQIPLATRAELEFILACGAIVLVLSGCRPEINL